MPEAGSQRRSRRFSGQGSWPGVRVRLAELAAHPQPWLAFGAGGLAVLGLPPGPGPFPMILGLTVLIRLIATATFRRGAWYGFLFGLAHFGFGFSWLLTSLHDNGGLSMPVSLLMLGLLAAGMALYTMLFGALLRRFAPRAWLLPLAAPALWTLCEWLRSRLLTGFAWNLAGYAWDPWGAVLQVADLGGIHLLSWLAVFPAAVAAMVWLRGWQAREMLGGLGLVVGVLVVALLYGVWRVDRLADLQSRDIWAGPVRMALVQGNIAQHRKWDVDLQNDGFQRYVSLSRSLEQTVDLVIWPETAVALFLQASPEHMRRLERLSQHIGAPILTGAPMAEREEGGAWRFYNSMVLIDERGTLDRRYDKHHLVPFGEFIPFRKWVPERFRKFTQGTEDFSAGPGPEPMPWGEGAIGPLICYEAIFSHEVRLLANKGARWLVNITNDAWFGEWAKPQHLAMARLRAVENRLPMIRVANTGISAIFDQTGRELGRIGPNRTGTLVLDVPRGEGLSFFNRTGRYWVWVWMYLCAASWLIGAWRGQPSESGADPLLLPPFGGGMEEPAPEPLLEPVFELPPEPPEPAPALEPLLEPVFEFPPEPPPEPAPEPPPEPAPEPPPEPAPEPPPEPAPEPPPEPAPEPPPEPEPAAARNPPPPKRKRRRRRRKKPRPPS